MLEIKGLTKTFNTASINEKRVFENFSLTVSQDDFITIIGSNGAGKSTLLNIVAGSIPVDEGTIKIHDKDITKLPEYKRSKKMSRVYQNPALGTSPSLNIIENISMFNNKNKNFGLSFGVSKKNIAKFKEIVSVLGLGLENHLETKISMLSGGQRQALSLLMATLTKPEVLLLDEHTAALDPNTSKKIMEITEKIVKEEKIPTLMVTHNMNDAINYGNRLIMMDNGKIILDISGNEKKQLTADKLMQLFKDVKTNSVLSDRFILS
ncbi:MAG: ATP-binding cassette protein [Haloplasmataceae bacterium]|jgi:putative ABC transport system ATP-binding protein|nr:ATP-binding cassette protein [Haloplasmataceae bacterium]